MARARGWGQAGQACGSDEHSPPGAASFVLPCSRSPIMLCGPATANECSLGQSRSRPSAALPEPPTISTKRTSSSRGPLKPEGNSCSAGWKVCIGLRVATELGSCISRKGGCKRLAALRNAAGAGCTSARAAAAAGSPPCTSSLQGNCCNYPTTKALTLLQSTWASGGVLSPLCNAAPKSGQPVSSRRRQMGRRRSSQCAARAQAVSPACTRHTSQSSRTSCHSTVLCGKDEANGGTAA